jgi:hypothetical protein
MCKIPNGCILTETVLDNPCKCSDETMPTRPGKYFEKLGIDVKRSCKNNNTSILLHGCTMVLSGISDYYKHCDH